MKRMMMGAVLALTLFFGTQQRASAWVKANFNVGLNWTVEGGSNCFFWGLWRSGPFPGPNPYPYLANYGYGYPWPGYGHAGAGAPGARTPILARRRAQQPAPGFQSAPGLQPAPVATPSAQPPAISTTPTARQVGYTKSQPQPQPRRQAAAPYSQGSGVVGYGYTPGFQAPSYWYGD